MKRAIPIFCPGGDDPFAGSRRSKGFLMGDFSGESIPLILEHSELRKAARAWEIYSSDAPCRVPIPDEKNVRSVRQLPIESDPPEHTAYKKILLPIFRKPLDPSMASKIEKLVDDLLDKAFLAKSIDVASEFSLPLQSRALACLLNIPISEADLWISWGFHVFRNDNDDPDMVKINQLDDYIERKLDQASASPGGDFFSDLMSAEYKGRQLSREEMIGMANLTFAGGRDTVINLVTNSLGYISQEPSVLHKLRNEPSLVISATEEFVRFFSPLAHIGRVAACPINTSEYSVKEGERISFCWASANRDEKIFDTPNEIQIDRKPNPHVGFGFGTHSCLGAPLTRLIMRTVLKRILERDVELKFIEALPETEDIGGIKREIGYRNLKLQFIRH